MTAVLIVLGVLAAVAVFVLLISIRIVKEYERAVIFRLGRILGAKGPGLFLVFPILDKMVRLTLQTITLDITTQELITKDNVTVQVNGVAWFSVVEPVDAVVKVQNYRYATSQIAQTTLLSVLRQIDLDELLRNREEIGQRLATIIDQVTEPWGVKVSLVEIKDVQLPETMRRSMARQAEAERERRAKVISAQGELEASQALGEAAAILERHPAALRLRELSTLAEIAVEKNSTVVFPLPMEFLRLAEAITDQANRSNAGTD
jgi:regulator of protease activity HflC (stomatin/prohibitin superfamily)